ncbi:MAG: hypothetical protein ACJA08_000287 [Cyclobacteriaceae bacterium]|jgi:hypothetical protein
MEKLKKIILTLLVSIAAVAMMQNQSAPAWKSETPIFEVLESLGEKKPDHFVKPTPEKISTGEDLVKLGRATKANGKKSPYISKFYTCTSCHNLQREDPDLSVIDQDARLNYAIENQIPYLQESSFWGIVNRETWYNDDYVLKYGDLVRKAEHSLRESVELCAVVCSQGRTLENWEMESILAYIWSLQIKMGDLNL